MLNEAQKHLLHHTLGLRPDRREPFRNHFVAGNGHHDMPNLEALEALGLMARAKTPAFCDKEDIVFRVTDAGREIALKALPEPIPQKKRSRYGEFLDADGGWSFGEFLCGGKLPEFEMRGGGWGSRSEREYRMFRSSWSEYGGYQRDVEGVWATTKKDAKASYKIALKSKEKEGKSSVGI